MHLRLIYELVHFTNIVLLLFIIIIIIIIMHINTYRKT